MGLRFLIISILMFIASISFNLFSEEKKEKIDQVEMFISGIGFDQLAQTPVVILADKERKKVLPIWIGICEARAIEIGISDEVTPRPFTYDLVAAIFRTMNAKVERIVIVDLRDQVFYAQVEVTLNGNLLKIDARPSDAIALASRMNAPVYVNKRVLDNASTIEQKIEKKGT